MISSDVISIRPLLATDLDAILAIERASESAPHWRPNEYLACLEDDTANTPMSRIALVAEQLDSIIAFGVVRILIGSDNGEAELESIVVAAEFRAHGIGTALLAELFHAAERRGARTFDLEVRASNSSAIRLYERAGLTQTGRRPGYYRDPEEDAVLMRRNL